MTIEQTFQKRLVGAISTLKLAGSARAYQKFSKISSLVYFLYKARYLLHTFTVEQTFQNF